MKTLLTLLFLTFSFSVFSQNTDFSYIDRFYTNGTIDTPNKKNGDTKVGKWMELLDNDLKPLTQSGKHSYFRLVEYNNQGKEINKAFVFYSNNRVYKIEPYLEKEPGVLNGKMSTFHKNGSTLSITYYKNGIKHGQELVYMSGERILQERNYNNGKIHGEVIERYPNGKIKRIDQYVYGENILTIGQHKTFYKNGILEYHYDYDVAGKGETKHYNDKGILLETTNVVE